MAPNGFQHVIGLGNFPCDWLISSADEITEKITKGTTPPKSEIVEGSNIPFLRVNNLGFDGVLNSKSEMLFVTKQAHNGFLSRSVAYPNDILMNIVGPPLGKIAMLDDQYPEYNMNQAVLIYRCKEKLIDHGYFLSFLGSELAQQWLQSRSKKTSGQQNLTIQLCKELPTPVPSLPEQRKIAKILTTWDKAISTTEALIETSKQQKKALMQQLLTGKKRLVNPETGEKFEGEWKEVQLSNIAKISIGLVTTMTKHYVESGVPLIRNSDIKQNYIKKEKMIFLSDTFASENEHRKLKINDVVTVHTGEVGVSAVIEDDMAGCLGFATLNSRPNQSKVLPIYLSWYFNSDRFINWCVSMSTGDGRQNLNLKDFVKAIIHLPELTEQQTIASVLTAADKEIEIIESKLAHLKQEKKALMQQLLTGKRRVAEE